jgi:4-amino-4-deoxy-L-arabinose transferase-like glycosyltransferase
MEETEKAVDERKEKIKNKLFSWIEDYYDKIFIVVLIAAILIRFLIFLKTLDQALWYDGASYLATAKNWGLGLNIEDIWYYRRGFLFPLFYALFFKLGLGESSIRFTMILFSAGIVFVSYFLIKEMFNKELALFASAGLTMSWIFLFFTGRILTDIPAAFFLLTSLYFFWKGYVLEKGNKFSYLFGLFFALACLTRMQTLMFAPVFLVIVFLKNKFQMFKNKSLWITALIFLIILSPHFIIYYQHYGNPVTDILGHYFGIEGVSKNDVVPRTASSLFNYVKDLPYILNGTSTMFSGINVLFIVFLIGIILFFYDLLLGFDKLFKNSDIQKKLFIFLWILVPFLVLGYITDYVEHRYISACMPFIILIAVYPLSKFNDFFLKYLKNKKFVTILILAILIIIFLPSYNWANSLVENKKTSYLEVKQAGLWLKENSNLEDKIFTASQPQIEYYSERSSYTINFNKTEFEKDVKELNPKYLILSIFENHDPWMYAYPQEHNDTLIPVQAYQQQGQPVLIIYEFTNFQTSQYNLSQGNQSF